MGFFPLIFGNTHTYNCLQPRDFWRSSKPSVFPWQFACRYSTSVGSSDMIKVVPTQRKSSVESNDEVRVKKPVSNKHVLRKCMVIFSILWRNHPKAINSLYIYSKYVCKYLFLSINLYLYIYIYVWIIRHHRCTVHIFEEFFTKLVAQTVSPNWFCLGVVMDTPCMHHDSTCGWLEAKKNSKMSLLMGSCS